MKGYEPMQAKSVDVVPEDPDEFILEPKLDGWRAVAGVPSGGEPAWLETRADNRITSVPYIAEEVARLFPPGSIIDGEIVDGRGTRWNRVQTICSRDAVHVPTKADPALTYVVFDVLVVDGTDIRHWPLRDRRDILDSAAYAQAGSGVVRPIEWLAPRGDVLDSLLSEGFEGAVVKRLNAPYRSGKRDGAFIKIKPQLLDDDVVIVGFYDAEPGSKYEGRAVGGIEFLRSNGYVGRAAGMDDPTRTQMYNSPELFLGKVAELAHHGEFSDTGALRHPQFRRLRPDKSAEEVAPKVGAPKRVEAPKRIKPPKAGGSGRRRNYKAMGDDKLLSCLLDLSAESGDAWSRCVNDGSGDPAADLTYVRQLCDERGIGAVAR